MEDDAFPDPHPGQRKEHEQWRQAYLSYLTQAVHPKSVEVIETRQVGPHHCEAQDSPKLIDMSQMTLLVSDARACHEINVPARALQTHLF